MLTASCRICGKSKEPKDYAANECGDCQKLKSTAEAAFKEANPTAPDSDVLYAGRAALNARAHHAHKDFVDPRAFSGINGMIPMPPQVNREGA